MCLIGLFDVTMLYLHFLYYEYEFDFRNNGECGVLTVQPLITVSAEKPGGTNVSLHIVRSMGTYDNVTVYYEASQRCSANCW